MNNTSPASNIVAVTAENFQQVIVEGSKEQLVLVAFWAEQVPESMELLNHLVQYANQNPSAFILAPVDVAKEQMIAQQFGVRGLPTAVFVKEAQALDMIEGPQPLDAVDAFLAKNLPNEEDNLLTQAKELLAQGNVNDAFGAGQKAYQLAPERGDIQLTLSDIYLQLGKIAEAEALLSQVKMADQNCDYQTLMAKLELAQTASESPEVQALEQKLADDPDNVEIKRQLAAQYSQSNRQEDALELLFVTVRADLGDNETKTLLLDLMKALPDGDPLASKYRRKLYTLMY